MKTLKDQFTMFIFLTLLGACNQSGEEHISPIPDEFSNAHQTMRTMPFKAEFYTKRSYDDDGEGKCSDDPYLGFNLQIGEGNATHLGKFTTTMWFCGAGFDYKNGEGVFVAANGDELYFKVPATDEVGHVLPLPYEDPVYEFYFQDPFEFVGGTGRFEGASGGGVTDSYVDLFDDDGNFIPEHQTDHTWTGLLILPKNKCKAQERTSNSH